MSKQPFLSRHLGLCLYEVLACLVAYADSVVLIEHQTVLGDELKDNQCALSSATSSTS